MKALSIKQPWAWLVARGWKNVENRTWRTSFRGRFLIHAAKRIDPEDRLRVPDFRHLIETVLSEDRAIGSPTAALAEFERIEPHLALGAIIGEAEIYDCVDGDDWTAKGSPWFFGPYGFAIRNARMYDSPIPYRGALGFFDVNGVVLPGRLMRAVSLFSGVGGFEIGFERAGISTVLQCEIDQVAQSVLRRHWPEVARIANVRAIGAESFRAAVLHESDFPGGSDCTTASGRGEGAGQLGVDLVYGGFPCQDLSVAGRRVGLAGERSGLWHEFQRVVSELRPRYVVVENVPGLYSANERRDFATIVSGFTSIGYGVAWRAIDAQFLVVPQRRRRVFFVAAPDPGDGSGAHRAAEVLALCEGCFRDTQARRKKGKGAARGASEAAGVGGGQRDPLPLGTIPIQDGRDIDKSQNGLGVGGEADPAYTVDGTGSQSVMVFETRYARNGRGAPDAIVPPLKAQNGRTGKGDGAPVLAFVPAVAEPLGSVTGGFRSTDIGTNGGYVPIYVANAVSSRDHKGNGNIGWDGKIQGLEMTAGGLRRLMPVECERIMGWPDDWTRWDHKGQEIPDTHRYRLIGNGVVATVAEWIGRRLTAVAAKDYPAATASPAPIAERASATRLT